MRAAVDSLPVVERLVRQALDLEDPSRVVEPLVRYVRVASRAASGVACTTLTSNSTQPACSGAMGDLALALASTRTRASEALLDAAGVTVEATAPRELIAERDTLTVAVSAYNQGKTPFVLERLSFVDQPGSASQPTTVLPDSVAERRSSIERLRSDVSVVAQEPAISRHVHSAARGNGGGRRSAVQLGRRRGASRIDGVPRYRSRRADRLPVRRCRARRGAASARDRSRDHGSAYSTTSSTRERTPRSIE